MAITTRGHLLYHNRIVPLMLVNIVMCVCYRLARPHDERSISTRAGNVPLIRGSCSRTNQERHVMDCTYIHATRSFRNRI